MHSPFVYELLTLCLYKKEKRPAFEIIEEFRSELLKDDRKIKVTDFGAGSRVFKSNERKVSDIAKNAGISKKRAILLNKLISYFEIASALELGTSVGISSAAIAAGNKVNLTTLEGCPETAAVAGEYFRHFKLDNIKLEVGSFEEQLEVLMSGEWKVESGKSEAEKGNESGEGIVEGGKAPQPPKGVPNFLPNVEQQTKNSKRQTTTDNLQPTTYNLQPTTDNRQLRTDNLQPTTENLQPTTYNREPPPNNIQLTTYNPLTPQTPNSEPQTPNLVYFDGNHQKEATLKYFHQLLPLAHNESVFIFDDIHWSKGMEEAWEEIKSHPKVRVTIDSFFWGIVFFREEQEKEHFIIRL